MREVIILIFILTFSSNAFSGLKEANQFYHSRQFQSAISEYIPLAEAGNSEAQTKLGIMYSFGYGVEVDYAKALSLFEQAKAANYPEAMFMYADALLNGKGIKKSPKQAFMWFEKAGDLGYVAAQSTLGYLYLSGIGAKADFDAAFKWNSKAAKAGSPEAMYNLGQQYEKGKGAAKDLKQSVYWYGLAAEKNQTMAEFEMGYAYKEGIGGLQRDLEKAIHFYTKAANKGSTAAQYNLADIYLEKADEVSGNTRQQYLKNAEKLLTLAASKSDPKSSYLLSHLYMHGINNRSLGTKWLIIAAELGHGSAKDDLQEMLLMSPNQFISDVRELPTKDLSFENNSLLSKAVRRWEVKEAIGIDKEPAIGYLAAAYQYGLGVKKSYAKATNYYLKSFDTNSPKLKHSTYVGFLDLYRKALNKEPSAEVVSKMVNKAAEAGNNALLRFVAQCHCTNPDISSDTYVRERPFIMNWYQKAADKGDSIAKFVLAKLYMQEKEYEKAAKLYQQITDLPEMDTARYHLASLYSQGKGVKQNAMKAEKLLLEITDKSVAYPQLLLASLYADSLDTKDSFKARDLYLSIAEKEAFYGQNSSLLHASGRLADMFFTGQGGSKNYRQSYFWKALQIKTSSTDSSSVSGSWPDCYHLETLSLTMNQLKLEELVVDHAALDRYQKKLSADEVQQLDLQVKEWIQSHKSRSRMGQFTQEKR